MTDVPETSYARCDGIHVAYRVSGDGPLNVVVVNGFVSNIDLIWDLHIGARIAALAGPGEVLVSRTVTDLVAGSGIRFEDRGDHELNGVPGTWQLLAARAGSAAG